MNAKDSSEPGPTPAAFDPGPLAEPPEQLISWAPDKRTFTPDEIETAFEAQRRFQREQRTFLALQQSSRARQDRYYRARWRRVCRDFRFRRPIWTRRELAGLYETTACGRCLEPLIPDGARLWFELGAEAHAGDIVLCMLDPLMVERMRSEPDLIAANGRPTRGGTYVKQLSFVMLNYFLATNGSMTIIADQDEDRHRIIGVLRHFETDGDATPNRACADNTANNLGMRGDSNSNPIVGRNGTQAVVSDPSNYVVAHTFTPNFKGSFRVHVQIAYAQIANSNHYGNWRIRRNNSTVVYGPISIAQTDTADHDYYSSEITVLATSDVYTIEMTAGQHYNPNTQTFDPSNSLLDLSEVLAAPNQATYS